MKKMSKQEVIDYIEKMISDYKEIIMSEHSLELSEKELQFIKDEINVLENIMFYIY